MKQKDLLKFWLTESYKATIKREVEARKTYNELKDKSTPFAKAVAVIANAHEKAAEAYEQYIINNLETEEAEKVIGCSIE